MNAEHRGRPGTVVRWAVAAAILMLCLLYVPTPYAVYTPGLVAPVGPMVQTAGGERDTGGSFMLTTIRMTYANYWMSLQSMWNPDMLLYSKREIIGDRSQSEYAARLVYVMQQSQSNAIEAAYRAAEVPYRIVPEQLVVTDAPQTAEPGLRPGDRLQALEGLPFKDAQTLTELLEGRGGGDSLQWTIIRQGREQFVTTVLQQPPADAGAGGLPQALGGLQLAELRKLEPDDPAHVVRIDAGEIGGPSAGLIFALQVYDDLMPGDLTGGLRIAGTGTIDPSGEVGPIGGISLKITAAEQMGAELFLAPRENAEEAAARARQIGSGMKVIAVSSIGEAIEALRREVPTARS
ncbi:PDZ domain-containing protein [Paenibacillus sp. 1P07SE]|uniref:YlbL family protein n=1 Tax=Paenibacillus sp. 1P07SE TaxID=3132209 RepID=UPI0039A778BE